MASMLTDQQILAAVRGAFAPLRCSVEISGHQQKLRLRVFDSSDKTVVTSPEQMVGAIRNVESLRAFLEMVRAKVQAKGHQLGPLRVL